MKREVGGIVNAKTGEINQKGMTATKIDERDHVVKNEEKGQVAENDEERGHVAESDEERGRAAENDDERDHDHEATTDTEDIN